MLIHLTSCLYFVVTVVNVGCYVFFFCFVLFGCLFILIMKLNPHNFIPLVIYIFSNSPKLYNGILQVIFFYSLKIYLLLIENNYEFPLPNIY